MLISFKIIQIMNPLTFLSGENQKHLYNKAKFIEIGFIFANKFTFALIIF